MQDIQTVRIFRNQRGLVCRVVKQTIKIEQAPQSAEATVCQQPDGQWMLDGSGVTRTTGLQP
jgi:surface antigen